jgi:hypothetical protein
MRFMMLVKASPDSEAGGLPDAEGFEEMGKFNTEMVRAGVMLAADGLQPSSKGARVSFSGGKRTVIDGPFTETTELIAGYWMIEVKSKEEAVAWACRVPFQDGQVEVRQVFEAADIPDENITPEHRARMAAMRDELQRKAAQT